MKQWSLGPIASVMAATKQCKNLTVWYVLDSLASDTEVPDSQFAVAIAERDDSQVAAGGVIVGALQADDEAIHALVHLASIREFVFETDKAAHEVANLMLPIMLPCLYGEHDEDVLDAARTLLWTRHGYVHGHFKNNRG
ncbi:hypothetical protein E2562_004566 [Oryza meyeriana var. granulata]|uniref:Uncharacterized protein n=1 Tax=Oryza meyeriana var. granulata TaxID=110450 RepID=A0A6G1F3M3_9ORYZ|nr:hypothetical protein E2562_004566 [Oryza meyeriana var. granulata]